MKDRDRLIELLREARERYIYTDEQAQFLVDNGATSVVRCKDCKFYNVFALACMRPYGNIIMKIDDFCSYGERKKK